MAKIPIKKKSIKRNIANPPLVQQMPYTQPKQKPKNGTPKSY